MAGAVYDVSMIISPFLGGIIVSTIFNKIILMTQITYFLEKQKKKLARN